MNGPPATSLEQGAIRTKPIALVQPSPLMARFVSSHSILLPWTQEATSSWNTRPLQHAAWTLRDEKHPDTISLRRPPTIQASFALCPLVQVPAIPENSLHPKIGKTTFI